MRAHADVAAARWSFLTCGRNAVPGDRVVDLEYRREHALATVGCRLPRRRAMGVAEGIVVIVLVLGIASLIYLSRSRAGVMSYHDISTPRVNETTHGEEGSF